MNRIAEATPPAPAEADLYRYGWRYVKRTLPEGTVEFDQIPLTLEDVLHPQFEDVIPQNSAHGKDRCYLFDVLNCRVAEDATALVLSDVLVVWDIAGLRPHSPDLSVIFGVREPHRNINSFDVATERTWPTLVIEIVSPHCRDNDVIIKVEHYYRARVPLYVIVDRQRVEGPIRLVGYRYTPSGYEPMPLDDQGRLRLEAFGLWLGTRGNRVVCYDSATGRELGDYTRLSDDWEAAEARAAEEGRGRQEAEARARAEAEARAAADARVRELEAELRRLRGQPENG
jgi:hypothetical protein